MAMAISELLKVVPAPSTPIEAGRLQDVPQLLAQTGLRLPDDLLQFGMHYGSGKFGGSIEIYNPFALRYLSIVNSLASTYRSLKETEGDDYIPFAVFPDTPGLFPWGNGVEGERFFWFTEGEPDSWPIVLFSHSGEFEQWNLSMTTLLTKFFTADIDSMLWDREWLEENFRGIQFKPERLA
jgi:hypothetical protein